MLSCETCGTTAHRDDAMERRCNGCEYLVRQCICERVNVKIALKTRQEADHVFAVMNAYVSRHGYVSVGILHDLVSISSTHSDEKRGWVDTLNDVTIEKTDDDCYRMIFPPTVKIM